MHISKKSCTFAALIVKNNNFPNLIVIKCNRVGKLNSYPFYMYTEQKIASFQQGKDKLQLLKITKVWQSDQQIEIGSGAKWMEIKYQVRLNRKRIDTSISEYEMRKLFATYTQNIVLQLKIY